MRLWLLITCGYPFSGKSTLAQAISDGLGMTLVAVDEQHRALGFDRANGNPGDREWLRAYRSAYRGVEQALSERRSVVFDSVGFRRRDRDRAWRIAERHGAGSVVLWLDVSADEARDRLKRNGDNPTRPQVPFESFDRIVTEFEPPQSDEPTVIYGPDIEPETWVEQVLRPVIER